MKIAILSALAGLSLILTSCGTTTNLYENPDVIKLVPLYPKLKGIIERAYPPVSLHINDQLSAFGKRLNDDLGTN